MAENSLGHFVGQLKYYYLSICVLQYLNQVSIHGPVQDKQKCHDNLVVI